MSRLTRDGTAEPVSRDQILRHARGQGNIYFTCSDDHEQDWLVHPGSPFIHHTVLQFQHQSESQHGVPTVERIFGSVES